MKKIAIYIIVLGIAFSYSCKKEIKLVRTQISGRLLTAGTNNAIIMSSEEEHPKVILFENEMSGSGLGYGPNTREVASTIVSNTGSFSFDIELKDGVEHYLGYININPMYYFNIESLNYWYNLNLFPVIPGQNNFNANIYALPFAWIQPRFINTNSDHNNTDILQYLSGFGDLSVNNSNLIFTGPTDTIIPYTYKPMSSTYLGGIQDKIFSVTAKLTRNGIIRDTSIIYIVPPLDTTIVEIRY